MKKSKCKRILCKAKIDDKKINITSYDTSEREIRYKRMEILFKVIYVIAILFGAMFIEISKNFGKGLNSAYIIESLCTSFLFCLGAYMVVYIVNELKCLKIGNAYSDEIQSKITENSYNNIFLYLKSGLVIFIFLLTAVMLLPKKYILSINMNVLASSFVTPLGIVGVITFIQLFGNVSKENAFFKHLKSCCYTISLASIFIASGLQIK